ncbi:uncharacterized protein LOC121052627 [Rosa chinensis]|uniref:uncharacterized protein LOC121052627 n=1 Tax=Rosa chinensis TaxID=74649 RepID=UPI001AD92A61|nr:uncharacterized protein LOC121052627 [Rosa chinensis]
MKECGARLIYSDDVPNFIQSLLQQYSPADHDVIGDYKLRNPDKSISTECFFSGPSGIFQKEKNSTDQLELLKQVAELIPSHEPTPFFIENEPPGYDSSSTKVVGELRRNIELVLHQLFEGGNAGYYDYGFTVSPKLKAILPWFSDQSLGGEVLLPHSPPDLYKDKTWLGLSVYAAFTVSPENLYHPYTACTFPRTMDSVWSSFC